MKADFGKSPATKRTAAKPATFLKANEGEKGESKIASWKAEGGPTADHEDI